MARELQPAAFAVQAIIEFFCANFPVRDSPTAQRDSGAGDTERFCFLPAVAKTADGQSWLRYLCRQFDFSRNLAMRR